MRNRHQHGCLRRTARKSGPERWEFLWRENTSDGKRVRRTAVIGTVERHASSRCTLEVYSQANAVAKRQAQQHVVAMILPGIGDAEVPIPRGNFGASI
jgi:hypothetical protein